MTDIAEVDLYADVVDTFSQNDDHNSSINMVPSSTGDRNAVSSGQIDMLDEVIAASTSHFQDFTSLPSKRHRDEHLPNKESSIFHGHSQAHHSSNQQGYFTATNSGSPGTVGGNGKRVCLYVQNLSWWTTDEDLYKSLQKIEIDDLVEIKFLENRVNGQSKGVAIITVASDNSARLIIERLPRMDIHGQNADVSHANRQNLHSFDLQNSASFGGNQGPSSIAAGTNGGNRRDAVGSNNIGLGQLGIPRGYNQNVSIANNATLPIGNQAAAAFLINQIAQQASLFQQQRPMQQSQQRPPDMLAAMAQLTARFRSPHPRHINPGAMQWNRVDDQRSDIFTPRMMVAPRVQSDHNQMRESDAGQMDPVEMQQLLERNKIISSNALAAAVQSATDADYSTAIETLVTAISLIRQSKIANDERSQILVSNLQNTLRSIEEKSYLSAKPPASREKHTGLSSTRSGGHHSNERLLSDRIQSRRSPSLNRRDTSVHRSRHSRSPLTFDDKVYSKRGSRRSPPALQMHSSATDYHRSQRGSSSSSSGSNFRYNRRDGSRRHGSRHSPSRGYNDHHMSYSSSDRRRR
ncbi:hypothetical protein GJ496_008997 [Pomphorhynchus laevis]|nr:hypothetical protein GJ496_008997 [Pomphorhynchus laevis]